MPITSTTRDPIRERREEIIGCLTMRGFGRKKLATAHTLADDSGDYATRLADLLEALGPVFASFGLYLASRPDLLTLADCVKLAAISNHSGPAPRDEVKQLVRAELDSRTAVGTMQPTFVTFEPEPFESRLLYQCHYGELDNGDLVVVKIVTARNQLNQDLKLLGQVVDAVTPRLTDPHQFQKTVGDFRLAINEFVNCENAAESLETLALDTRDRESLCVPKVYRELCSQNILVTERLHGLRLDKYIAQRRSPGEPPVDPGSHTGGVIPDELARLLCDVWLRQAFDGSMLPVDIRPENILIRSATEIAILGGTFVSIPAASRRNLLDYFIAVATDEPSKALTCLVREVDSTNRNISESTLDRLFRQLVAFRDGGWDDGGRANCLSDTLFAHWRLASQSGFRPLRHLIQIFRGTIHIASLARRVAPHRDSLLEGVKDLRMTKLLNDIGMMMEPGYWGGQMDRLAALMILGPQHLDGALKAFSDEKTTSVANANKVQHRASAPRNPLLLLLLVFATPYLFYDQLADLIAPPWAERLAALIVVAAGSMTLRWMTSYDQS